jgi:uncharacterized protein (UPF0276 family)
MTNSLFKDLGVGVGLRPPHYSHFLDEKPSSVAWVEVISENFLPWKNQEFGRSFQTLEKIRNNYPVVLHGVSMSIGSVDPLNDDYLKNLKNLADRIQPAWVSDHLCWTGVNGENLHDLMPVPYTQEALDHISRRIDQVQNKLGRRILIENPSSYLEFQQSEMSEWDFLAALVQKSDCGLLLDINNVYVSSVNHGYDPIHYLKSLPRERVGQIHLAGHSNMSGYLIDTHDAPVCQEVLDLYRWSAPHFGHISTMLERDGNIPEWEELEKEILTIEGIRHEELKKSG